MIDPFCYVIAESEQAARDVLQSWILSSPQHRRTMEFWSICFKGYPDAEVQLERYKKVDDTHRSIWRIDIGVREA